MTINQIRLFTSLRIFLIYISVSISGVCSAQNFTAEDKFIKILGGSTYIDTVYSSVDIKLLNVFTDPMGELEITCTDLGSSYYQVKFSFEKSNFLGNKSFIVQTFAVIPTINKLIRYHFEVVEAVVVAKDDFVKLSADQTKISIAPLSNDDFNDNQPKTLVLTDAKYGQGIVNNNVIEYELSKDQAEDIILYTVKNVTGTQDRAAVYVYREQSIKSDIIKNISLAKGDEQIFILPSNGVVATNPSQGSIVKINDQVYQYTHSGSTSSDKVVFFVKGYYVVYQIKVVAKAIANSNLKNDIVFTGVNNSVTFNVFENDASPSTVFNHSPELTYLGNGSFSYQPDRNFVGAKKFFYESGSRLSREIAEISLNVGNIAPINADYILSVARDGAYHFSYDVPVNGYSLNINTYPQHGSASSYIQMEAVGLDCGSIQGKAVVSYYPHPGYTGADEVLINYCMVGSPCQVYRIKYNVIAPNTTFCDCGTDCIREGDTNRDGVVSPMDLLPIGRSYGFLSTQKNAQSGLQHLDGNGDNVINRPDIGAIVQNIGKYNKLVASPYTNDRTFAFRLIPHQTEVDSGDVVRFDIAVGDDVDPLVKSYGLGFNLSFNPGFLHDESVKVVFDQNSWFADLSPIIDLSTLSKNGLVQAAISRTHEKGITGKGIIGSVYGIVRDEANGFQEDGAEFVIQNVVAGGITMEYEDGSTASAKSVVVPIKVNRKAKDQITVADQVNIYPNPSNGEFFISVDGQDAIQQVALYDLSGQLVRNYSNVGSKQLAIVLQDMNKGVYLAKVQTNTTTVTKKFTLF